MGAIHLGKDWTHRGTSIRYNVFRDFGTDTAPAVHFGDFTAGNTVWGNFFIRVASAVVIEGGRNNTIENNVFVDCSPAVRLKRFDPEEVKSRIEKLERAVQVDFRHPPFSTRYPELRSLKSGDLSRPEGNRIIRNILTSGVISESAAEGNPSVLEEKDNFFDIDPGFVDPARDNYAIRQDSPVYSGGFQYIPINEIGLKLDIFRVTIPENNPAALRSE